MNTLLRLNLEDSTWNGKYCTINSLKTKRDLYLQYPVCTAQRTLSISFKKTDHFILNSAQVVYSEIHKNHKYTLWAECTVFIGFVMSVCPFVSPSLRMEQLCTHRTDFHKTWYLSIFLKSVEKIQIFKRKRITGTSNDEQYTFFNISRSIILRIRNVSDKSCRENQNTPFIFSNFFFLKLCRF